MMLRHGILTGVAATIAACAPQAGEPSRSAMAASETGTDCFFASQISGYTVAGRDRIRVSTGPRDTYEFETLGSCPELDRGNAIGFDKSGPGTICRGLDVTLVVPTSIGPQRCPVRMIRKLEPAPAN
ncbi:MAG TPA: DUF6491 family protein [Novosphingobium sp.]|nr:DUF6491 family protein [Novosphingobium sp.]